MTDEYGAIKAAVAKRLPEAQKFLSELIAIPSLPGQEAAAMDHAAGAFARLGKAQRVALSDSLRQDKDYSDPIPGISYTGRSNLRVSLAGSGGGRRLLLNTHMDTVPPSQGQERPYDPQVRDGCIYGRGSCDAKGQVATVYLLMAALRELGVTLPGELAAHIVVEEEVGGNGTLAMARTGEKADGCIVLEPTAQRILSSIRGAVWFRVTLKGQPGHSGKAGKTRSALKMGIRLVEILEGYHDELLARSRGDALFDKYLDPMPLTIGQFHAGNWPATAPGEAVLEGVLGLLPNVTAAQVMEEMTAAISRHGGPEIAENFKIHFMYRHDSSVTPVEHPLVEGLRRASAAAGHEAGVDAMTASCDAWFYNNQLGVPTVVYGGGSLGVAHSNNEHIPVADLASAAETLVTFVLNWCGAGK